MAVPGRRAASFPALRIAAPGPSEDAIAGLLWEAGTTGIEELAPGLLRAFFAQAPATALARRLREVGATRVAREEVKGADWVGRARRLHRAVRVGSLLLRAPWSRARPRRAEREIVLDPARAFGTGSHESTRLVLRELLAIDCRGLSVLDVGTGSGVLALAAAQRGGSPVVALDVDGEAVLAAMANARRNRLGRAVRARAGTAGSVRRRFDLVLANLTAVILERESAALAARVARDGTLVVAGFLGDDEARIAAAFAWHGLAVAAVRREAAWSALRLRLAPAGAAVAARRERRVRPG